MHHELKSSNNFHYSLKKLIITSFYILHFLMLIKPHNNTNFVRACILCILFKTTL